MVNSKVLWRIVFSNSVLTSSSTSSSSPPSGEHARRGFGPSGARASVVLLGPSASPKPPIPPRPANLGVGKGKKKKEETGVTAAQRVNAAFGGAVSTLSDGKRACNERKAREHRDRIQAWVRESAFTEESSNTSPQGHW